MTQGFYEQLGVDQGSSLSSVRSAYSRCVAQNLRRRKAVVEQGGDPSPLDLARSQLDEAWKVLSDPTRRRRYDAMLTLVSDGWTTDSTELWKKVSGALVSPPAGAAAELLRVATNLKVGALPPPPRPRGRAAPAPEEVTRPTATPRKIAVERPAAVAPSVLASPVNPPPIAVPKPRAMQELVDFEDADAEETSDARVVPLPTRGTEHPTRATDPLESPLRVVHGSGSSVVVMPTQKRRKTLSSEDVARLVERHGHTGALLRAVREAKAVSLQELAETTRISIRYLEAIELDQRDRLPSTTFVRGYVREMARQLELDEQSTVSGYMRRLGG